MLERADGKILTEPVVAEVDVVDEVPLLPIVVTTMLLVTTGLSGPE